VAALITDLCMLRPTTIWRINLRKKPRAAGQAKPAD